MFAVHHASVSKRYKPTKVKDPLPPWLEADPRVVMRNFYATFEFIKQNLTKPETAQLQEIIKQTIKHMAGGKYAKQSLGWLMSVLLSPVTPTAVLLLTPDKSNGVARLTIVDINSINDYSDYIASVCKQHRFLVSYLGPKEIAIHWVMDSDNLGVYGVCGSIGEYCGIVTSRDKIATLKTLDNKLMTSFKDELVIDGNHSAYTPF